MNKKVIIELTVKMIVEVPKVWNKHNIEFWLNESSHCLENEIIQLTNEIRKRDIERPDTCSICHRATGKYIKDANEKDIKYLQ